jgi:hypothetical protein
MGKASTSLNAAPGDAVFHHLLCLTQISFSKFHNNNLKFSGTVTEVIAGVTILLKNVFILLQNMFR